MPAELQKLQVQQCCQTKKIVTEIAPTHDFSGRVKLAPLDKCGSATVFEVLPAVESSFLVEVVVNGAMNGGEFLQTSHAPEAQNRAFPSSGRLMGVLGAAVQPAAGLENESPVGDLAMRATGINMPF